MAISEEKLYNILESAFPNATIKITDLLGDQDHYSLHIQDKQFAGMPLIAQHKAVKAALSTVLQRELHAITIKTSAL